MAHISLLQHWEHSIRMGSPAGAVGSALNALGSTVYGPKQWRTKVESVIGRHALRRGQLRLDGSLLDIPPTAPPYIAGLLRLDEYETAERYAIAKFLPRSIPVIEFGAGIGAIACLTNRLLRDRSQHWVVEANPAMIPVLTGNRDRNG